MGVIEAFFSLLFGNGRNIVRETAEVFRENAEASGQRDLSYRNAALNQFAAEFVVPRRGRFDRFMDGLNRVPRPALALGTLGMFISAMVNPVWFSARMQGISLVPDPLWWLLGAIVSFYFGARHQTKTQEFQRSIADTMARVGDVTKNLRALEALQAGSQSIGVPDAEPEAVPNAALDKWRQDSGI